MNNLVPATQTTGIARVWRALVGWMTFRAAPVTQPPAAPVPHKDAIHQGSDYARGGLYAPTYDSTTALSAYAAFPWVYAAMIRACRDYAGVPLVVMKGRRANAVALDDHPLYDLLDRPSIRVSGRQFRQQQYLDASLAGNHVGYVRGMGRAISVIRLHPQRVQLEPDPTEGWGDYVYMGSGIAQRIPAAAILHLRTPSWEDDPRGLWGTGAIQSINNDLSADAAASKTAANLSKRGRPDIIVKPATGTPPGAWTETFRDQLKSKLDNLLTDGGSLVIGAGAEIDLPSWTPRDMEFPQLRQLVREAVLAVTGVPPHLVGLPVANYAQAEAQERSYWERLQSFAADACDATFTPLARMYDRELSVRGDFSRIGALSTGRTEAVRRVQLWKDMGIPLVDAAAYEGFVDLPEPVVVAAPEPTPPAVRDFFAKALEPAYPRGYERTASDRHKRWLAIMDGVHTPMVARATPRIADALQGQAARIATRLDRLNTGRAVGDEDLAGELAALAVTPEEDALLAEDLREAVRGMLVTAYDHGSVQVGKPSLAWAPLAISASVDAQLGALVGHANQTTIDAVRDAVAKGLTDGQSVADIAARLKSLPAFDATRALLVARTEATKSLSAGSRAAYKDAVAAGVRVRKEYLSAHDSHVRLTHATADGQVRELDEEYVLSDGDHGHGPGAFTKVENNAGCRCCDVPVVGE